MPKVNVALAIVAVGLLCAASGVRAEPSTRIYSGNVVCVAGCGDPTPHLVQPMRHPLPTHPLPRRTARDGTVQAARGVWCMADAGCVAVPAAPPFRGSIDRTATGVSLWFW